MNFPQAVKYLIASERKSNTHKLKFDVKFLIHRPVYAQNKAQNYINVEEMKESAKRQKAFGSFWSSPNEIEGQEEEKEILNLNLDNSRGHACEAPPNNQSLLS